jgi:glycerol-3-phosphate dehydrogenase
MLGLRIYELLTLDRNSGIHDPARRLPAARGLSKDQFLAMFPELASRADLTGAVHFHDGQMHSPARLGLAYLKSAAQFGAEVANYVEVTGFLREGNTVTGVEAVDKMTGMPFVARGRVVLNTAGPWAPRLLDHGLGIRMSPPPPFSRDAFFVVARSLVGRPALAVSARTRDPDAFLSRGERHLFLVPWRDHTLVGVWHVVYKGNPDAFTVCRQDVEAFLDEINTAHPGLALRLDDVSACHSGLVLFGDNRDASPDLRYGKRSLIVDHSTEHQIDGLLTVIGVRYTTSRAVAATVVDRVFVKLGRPTPPSPTATTPLYGGAIARFDEFMDRAVAARHPALSEATVRALVRNHGAAYTDVLGRIAENSAWAEPLGSSPTTKAEVVHAVRAEMAQTLADVVRRRTDLGGGGAPETATLMATAELTAGMLGWNDRKTQKEVEEVQAGIGACTFADAAEVNV